MTDRMSLGILWCIYLVAYILDITTGNYKTESLALSSIGVVLFPIMLILYKNSIKHRSFNIIFTVLHAYLILVINLDTIIIP